MDRSNQVRVNKSDQIRMVAFNVGPDLLHCVKKVSGLNSPETAHTEVLDNISATSNVGEFFLYGVCQLCGTQELACGDIPDRGNFDGHNCHVSRILASFCAALDSSSAV